MHKGERERNSHPLPRRRSSTTTQPKQRIQQRPTHSPCPTRSSSTTCPNPGPLTTGSSSSLRHKHGPLADHVGHRQRQLVLVGLELELAFAEDEGLGFWAEAGDLACGDVEGAWGGFC